MLKTGGVTDVLFERWASAYGAGRNIQARAWNKKMDVLEEKHGKAWVSENISKLDGGSGNEC